MESIPLFATCRQAHGMPLGCLATGKRSTTGLRLATPALLVSLTLAGCGRPNPDERPVVPSKVLDFDLLFGKHCAGCHGAEGRMGPSPPLDDKLLVAVIPRDVLTTVINDGRGTLMPAFAKKNGGSLTEAQVEAITEGIRTRWGASMPPHGTPPAYLLPQQKGNKQAGEKLFAQICANCHGKDGRGKMAGALNDPAFLSLISDQTLRRIMITGRPDLGMPDYRGLGAMSPSGNPLTSAQISDLLALLDSWRQPQATARR